MIKPDTRQVEAFWDMAMFDSGKPAVLRCAISHKLFDHIDENTDARAVAESMKTHPSATRTLLDMLAILGILEKGEEGYSHTTFSQHFLDTSSPTYVGDMFLTISRLNEAQIANMGETLKSGSPSIPPEQTYTRKYWAAMVSMFQRCQRAFAAYDVLPEICNLPEFNDFKSMLDLGGNAGEYTRYLLSRNPGLTGVVLDTPEVMEHVRPILKASGIGERIRAIGADFLKDDIGSGYDLILVNYCLNPFVKMFPKLFISLKKALNPDGVLVCHHLTMEASAVAPRNAAWMSHVRFFGGVKDQLFTHDIPKAMVRSGFKRVESVPLNGYLGLGRMDIARK